MIGETWQVSSGIMAGIMVWPYQLGKLDFWALFHGGALQCAARVGALGFHGNINKLPSDATV